MAAIFPGRFTAQCSEPFLVFLIGMRVNRFFALRKWTRVAAAMPPMIAELKRNPALGLLHAQFFVYWRGVGVLQYWRSFDDLLAYAHDRNAAHLPAWAEFNRRVGVDGSVGIWHETYTWHRGSMRASTPTCRASASPMRSNTRPSPGVWKAPGSASAGGKIRSRIPFKICEIRRKRRLRGTRRPRHGSSADANQSRTW